MTAPRGGRTTVTPGDLRRTTVIFDEYTIKRLDAEVELLQQRGRGHASRSWILRKLVREHLKTP